MWHKYKMLLLCGLCNILEKVLSVSTDLTCSAPVAHQRSEQSLAAGK
jgi:hypothetical protein